MQERAKKTIEKIRIAAIEEFSEKGFHGARVDQIAEKAEVNKQRIYAYFKNKEGLFGEVLKHCYELISKTEDTLVQLIESDIPQLGEKILYVYMDFHQDNPEFWRLLAWENLDGGRHVEAIREIRNDSFDHIRILYEKGQSTGVFKKNIEFESFIFMLTSISYFYFSNLHTMSKVLQRDLSQEEVKNKLVKDCLSFLSLTDEIVPKI